MDLLSAGREFRKGYPVAIESEVMVEVRPGGMGEMAMRGRRQGVTTFVIRSCSCLYNIALRDPSKESLRAKPQKNFKATGTEKVLAPKSASSADRHRVMKNVVRIVTPFDPLKEGI